MPSTSESGLFDNLAIFHRKKQIKVSFSCFFPVIANDEIRHSSLRTHRDGESYFDKVMTKFTINNRTDEWKIDVNLLIRFLYQFTVVQSRFLE